MGWSACFRKCTRCLGARGGDAEGWSVSASTLCIPLQPHSSKALPRFSGDVYTYVVGAKNWQLRQVLARLAAGDMLMVTRLDRLARSTRDLLNTLAAITGKGAGFKSLGDAWADTTTPHGHLLLTVLGGLAEFERELIRARTSEGRARAKARGVHMGRPPTLTAFQRQEAIQRREAGETLKDIGRSYNVSHSTISRL